MKENLRCSLGDILCVRSEMEWNTNKQQDLCASGVHLNGQIH